ncbi:CubicO group peptidase, beta-lactamase class C family [Micromonospora pattaloongensis]|uniref:CubicO group peptidase, beta-lactamase class C family n=1 Tax=Micromonospora pattaloongensis TaxID=405436 RepID=A0A1H3NMV5_9ACTN|nr:serine hydrolase domain-containing protein [Micromonospora pattaloongensis]SDY89539.1 CubicO group peptidase, beta-lactamase class C family [Micromonospora pattaloongensis]
MPVPSRPSGPPRISPADISPADISPADLRFRQDRLRRGDAREVGLLPEQVDRIAVVAAAHLEPTADHPDHPSYAGAVVLAAKDGVIVQHAAVGSAVRYASPDVELPVDRRVPTRPDTVYDLASVSKLFTAVALLQQAERGRVELDAPVAAHLPGFAAGGKAEVTVRMLLTHTAGLPASVPLWRDHPTPARRLAAALAVVPSDPPGSRYRYSDLGFIALGALVERVSGQPLDAVVREGITAPLGLHETGYNPASGMAPRIAATEYQPGTGRGMVRGGVHDENAWSLGGVAGHAGLFGTAVELAVLCQALLNGGVHRDRRILRETTVRAMLANHNVHLGSADPASDRGLGVDLNAHEYMMGLASPVACGHTGFTGTSVVIDPLARAFVILLSNRVHPDRAWGGVNPARRAVAGAFAEAMPVRPLSGAAWRAESRAGATVTLTAPLRRPARAGRLRFALWYDTEPRAGVVSLQTSPDGLAWSPTPMSLHGGPARWHADGTVTGYGGRRWWQVSADLVDGTTQVRWASVTNGPGQGRGVYVDRITAADGGGVLFDGGDGDRPIAHGWAPASA